METTNKCAKCSAEFTYEVDKKDKVICQTCWEKLGKKGKKKATLIY